MPYWRIRLLTPVNFKLSVAVSEVFWGGESDRVGFPTRLRFCVLLF
jgi:hypothetical protein